MEIECPFCNVKLEAPEGSSEVVFECPSCGRVFRSAVQKTATARDTPDNLKQKKLRTGSLIGKGYLFRGTSKCGAWISNMDARVLAALILGCSILFSTMIYCVSMKDCGRFFKDSDGVIDRKTGVYYKIVQGKSVVIRYVDGRIVSTVTKKN